MSRSWLPTAKDSPAYADSPVIGELWWAGAPRKFRDHAQIDAPGVRFTSFRPEECPNEVNQKGI